MNSEQEANVRMVAYRLWEEEGRPTGREQEHWYRAEAMVLEVGAAAQTAVSTKPKATNGKKAPKATASDKPKPAKPAPKTSAKAKSPAPAAAKA